MGISLKYKDDSTFLGVGPASCGQSVRIARLQLTGLAKLCCIQKREKLRRGDQGKGRYCIIK
jgi:hypothetical protein